MEKGPPAFDPLSLLTGCKKKSSQEEELAKIRENDPDKHRSIAWGLSRLGKYKKAIKEFKLYLAKDPNNLKVLEGLGIAYLMLGDLKGAEETFKKVLEIDPNDITGPVNLGSVYLKKGNLNEAEKYFNKVLEIAPNDKEVISHLGILYEIHNRLEEAERMYDLALKADPSDEIMRKSLAKINFRIGLNKLDNDEIELGKKALEKAASLDPNFVAPRLFLAERYIMAKEDVEAEKVLNEVLRASSDKAELELARDYLLTIYIRSGNIKHLEFAEKVLRNKIKKDPDIAHSHYLLGWVYQKKGDLKAADEEFKKTLKLDPRYKDKGPELKDPKYQP